MRKRGIDRLGEVGQHIARNGVERARDRVTLRGERAVRESADGNERHAVRADGDTHRIIAERVSERTDDARGKGAIEKETVPEDDQVGAVWMLGVVDDGLIELDYQGAASANAHNLLFAK